MINKVDYCDEEGFYELGFNVNDNFSNLFNLKQINDSLTDSVFGYYEGDFLVGFIHITKLYETLDIVNIVVDLHYRRKGIATKLINYVLMNYDDLEYIMLEVNEKNRNAINLYLKNGFYEINRRKRYYGDDDAIIMKRDV